LVFSGLKANATLKATATSGAFTGNLNITLDSAGAKTINLNVPVSANWPGGAGVEILGSPQTGKLFVMVTDGNVVSVSY